MLHCIIFDILTCMIYFDFLIRIYATYFDQSTLLNSNILQI